MTAFGDTKRSGFDGAVAVRYPREVMPSVLQLTIEIDHEEDGRWIAEILELPGVLAYGSTEAHAISLVKAIALVEIGERLQHGEPLSGGADLGGIAFRAA
jgi:predicted RNase H-like HicB family nuclease